MLFERRIGRLAGFGQRKGPRVSSSWALFVLVSVMVSVDNQNGSKTIVLSENVDHSHLIEILK